jgi:hypothetical protein
VLFGVGWIESGGEDGDVGDAEAGVEVVGFHEMEEGVWGGR